MLAATAFFTAPTDPLAFAGSRMIATDLLVMAVSINWLSVLVSPFEAATLAVYPSRFASAAATLPSVSQYGFEGSLTIMVTSHPAALACVANRGAAMATAASSRVLLLVVMVSLRF